MSSRPTLRLPAREKEDSPESTPAAENPSSVLPIAERIRLECLQLANIPGRPVGEVIDRAKQFEAWVIGKPDA